MTQRDLSLPIWFGSYGAKVSKIMHAVGGGIVAYFDTGVSQCVIVCDRGDGWGQI